MDKDFTITYTYGSYGEEADYGENAKGRIPAADADSARVLAKETLAKFYDWFFINNVHLTTPRESREVDYMA